MCVGERVSTDTLSRVTLYPAPSMQGRNNLLLKYSVPIKAIPFPTLRQIVEALHVQ